jgi:acyl-CoA thioesterase I
MCTSPVLGVSRPARRPSNVDLPDPDTPTIATASPARTSKLTPLRMVNAVLSLGTVFVRPSTRSSVSTDLSIMFILARVLSFCVLAAAPSLAAAATILVFGDSLSAAYGLPQERGWAKLLEKRLHDEGYNYRVANASVSGETTSGGASRLENALQTHRPDIVVIELGANDGLRGQSLDIMRRNLERMIDASRRAKAQVLLVGMRLPPNYGTAYTEKFQQTYVDVARTKKTAFVPFLLEGFADNGSYFQADRFHPTSEAQSMMLDTVWKGLKALLRR